VRNFPLGGEVVEKQDGVEVLSENLIPTGGSSLRRSGCMSTYSLYPGENLHKYPLDRRLDRSKTILDDVERWIEFPTLRPSSPQPVAVPTALPTLARKHIRYRCEKE
jgi:hypothetical protein